MYEFAGGHTHSGHHGGPTCTPEKADSFLRASTVVEDCIILPTHSKKRVLDLCKAILLSPQMSIIQFVLG